MIRWSEIWFYRNLRAFERLGLAGFQSASFTAHGRWTKLRWAGALYHWAMDFLKYDLDRFRIVRSVPRDTLRGRD